jgi:hypothetical protein
MSAEVLGSVPIPSAGPTPARAPAPAPRRSLSPAVLEPTLVNRLLGVATAIFAAPAAVQVYALLAGTGAPSLAAASGILGAAALFAVGFGWLVVTAPRIPALRAARLLTAALAGETALLAAAVAWQLFA